MTPAPRAAACVWPASSAGAASDAVPAGTVHATG